MSRKLELKKPRDHPVNRSPLKVLGFTEFNELAITDNRLEKSAAPLSKRRGMGMIVSRQHKDMIVISVALFALYRYING
jgi:hypothetical protein